MARRNVCARYLHNMSTAAHPDIGPSLAGRIWGNSANIGAKSVDFLVEIVQILAIFFPTSRISTPQRASGRVSARRLPPQARLLSDGEPGSAIVSPWAPAPDEGRYNLQRPFTPRSAAEIAALARGVAKRPGNRAALHEAPRESISSRAILAICWSRPNLPRRLRFRPNFRKVSPDL